MDKKIVIGLVAFFVILISTGAYWKMSDSKEQSNENTTENGITEVGTVENPTDDTVVAIDQPPTVTQKTVLTLGTNKYSNSPKVGYIYSCKTDYNNAMGGAGSVGSWINEAAGTWDSTQKVTVSGDVNWSNASANFATSGAKRTITANSLPINHNTGVYPIQSSDDAYEYDRNPNGISAQSRNFSLDANPVYKETPSCIGGVVGIAVSGVMIYNGFDAGGRDAVAYEVQDDCDGHPQREGEYHYHNVSDCLDDGSTSLTTSGHSALVGYAFDGFGIYGYRGEDGQEVENEDLDVCHGHSHEIEWDGKLVDMYHYHATREFPYTVGCFRGNAVNAR